MHADLSRNNKQGNAYIGTSGWSYEDWVGRFYPKDVRKKDWFGYFAQHFSTVELNATFYRLFPESTFEKWKGNAPKDFVYAVKMWRWVTHRKRLNDVAADTQTALERAALLGRHLGPILIQLPPGLHRDDGRLREYVEVLKECKKNLHKQFRFTIEFRHKSWLEDEVFEILKKGRIALCIADMPKLTFPRITTANFVYVRFHGDVRLYQTLYAKSTLTEYANWLKPLIAQGKDVYGYFNNDYNAHAIINAKQLRTMLEN